jgi:hypothetical protein
MNESNPTPPSEVPREGITLGGTVKALEQEYRVYAPTTRAAHAPTIIPISLTSLKTDDLESDMRCRTRAEGEMVGRNEGEAELSIVVGRNEGGAELYSVVNFVIVTGFAVTLARRFNPAWLDTDCRTVRNCPLDTLSVIALVRKEVAAVAS